MRTPSNYYKYLADKEIPIIVIFQALYSVCWRFANTIRRKHNCISAQEAIENYERYGEYEERYPLQKSILLDILDKYGVRDGYTAFKRHAVYRSLKDLVSAQYVTKLVKVLYEDGAVVVGLPDFGERSKDGNASLVTDRPLYYLWTDRIPTTETDTGNNRSQAEAETIGAE